MKTLLTADLKELIDHAAETTVSLYMPMHLGGADVQQDPIRLKNQLHEAEKSLAEAGWKSADAKKLLAPVHELLTNDIFWRQHCSGLAVFVAPSFFKYFRLPSKVDPLTMVGAHFHVKPLLRLFSNDGRYFILALSLNKARLFDATQYSVREMTLADAPDGLEDSLPASVHERQLTFHGEGPKSEGRQGSVYYGTGPGQDDNKENITRYFRQIDKALHDTFSGRRIPLVLAGVDSLLPLYRSVNTHFPLLDEAVTGNPDLLSPDALRDRAWGVVSSYFQQGRERAAGVFVELGGSGRITSDVAQSVVASLQGRIDTLFVPSGVHFWGRVDEETLAVEMHPDRRPNDQDLLDIATIQTVLKNGAVYVVEPDHMPGDGPVAAVFRF